MFLNYSSFYSFSIINLKYLHGFKNTTYIECIIKADEISKDLLINDFTKESTKSNLEFTIEPTLIKEPEYLFTRYVSTILNQNGISSQFLNSFVQLLECIIKTNLLLLYIVYKISIKKIIRLSSFLTLTCIDFNLDIPKYKNII